MQRPLLNVLPGGVNDQDLSRNDDQMFAELAALAARWFAEGVTRESEVMLAAFDRAAARHLGRAPQLQRRLPAAATKPL